MFKKRPRTEDDVVVARRKSIPQIVMINALLGIKEGEVMTVPDAEMSYGMVRVRVWQANNKLINEGETRKLVTRVIREGKKVVATDVFWSDVLN